MSGLHIVASNVLLSLMFYENLNIYAYVKDHIANKLKYSLEFKQYYVSEKADNNKSIMHC